MDRMSELKEQAENALYEAAKIGQRMKSDVITELQKQVELLTFGILQEKNKYDTLHTSHEKLVTSIRDARAKVREIKYHHSKPRASQHGNTTQICLLIESIFEQALKKAEEIEE